MKEKPYEKDYRAHLEIVPMTDFVRMDDGHSVKQINIKKAKGADLAFLEQLLVLCDIRQGDSLLDSCKRPLRRSQGQFLMELQNNTDLSAAYNIAKQIRNVVTLEKLYASGADKEEIDNTMKALKASEAHTTKPADVYKIVVQDWASGEEIKLEDFVKPREAPADD